jgi:hypothetical protein
MIKMLSLFVCFLNTGAAMAADIDLTEGQLTHAGNYATRVVAAKNNTGPIDTLKIECGFFSGSTLLAAGMGFAENVGAGQTVYVDVLGRDAAGSDRTECRVSNVLRH